MELIFADVCRDGGSLVADFRLTDGALMAVFLEVVGIPEPGQSRRFRHLHISNDFPASRCDPRTIVSKNSDAERHLLEALDEWLKSPLIDEEVNPKKLDRVRELRLHVLERDG